MFGWVEPIAPPIFLWAGRWGRALFRDESVLARLCFPLVLPVSLTHQTRLNLAKLGESDACLMREWYVSDAFGSERCHSFALFYRKRTKRLRGDPTDNFSHKTSVSFSSYPFHGDITGLSRRCHWDGTFHHRFRNVSQSSINDQETFLKHSWKNRVWRQQ